ncbi:hypothetical protein O181_032657 [Austropuccinia psidii MF-1]|uniref:Uncharacterized protein n=1 Tax=Austropuccinia psidii MF-1 TaxID=1389203 RepID=A0A9Q3H6F9_9BASI|nr:hypothetical protein [Austropuccinia psidii MF-1]
MNNTGEFLIHKTEYAKFANEMIVVFSPSRVSPGLSTEIVDDLNEEVVQPAPQYLPTPSPVNSENNQPHKIQTIKSELRDVPQNTRNKYSRI